MSYRSAFLGILILSTIFIAISILGLHSVYYDKKGIIIEKNITVSIRYDNRFLSD